MEVKKLHRVEGLEDEGQPLATDEDEDRQDEDDSGDTAGEDQQLNRLVDVPRRVATIRRWSNNGVRRPAPCQSTSRPRMISTSRPISSRRRLKNRLKGCLRLLSLYS